MLHIVHQANKVEGREICSTDTPLSFIVARFDREAGTNNNGIDLAN